MNYYNFLIEIWGETAHEYNPDRFIDVDGKYMGRSIDPNGVMRNNMVPFSIGKRDCIGKVLAEREFILFFVGLMNTFEFIKVQARSNSKIF